MIKVVGYLRVSARKQIGGGGYERQSDRIRKFCTSANMDIERIYREQVTGTADETKRPVWTEMMNDILSHNINSVVVESLDRLARTIGVQELLVTYLASKNINLYSANTGENITAAVREDPMKEAMIYFQAIIAKLERNQILLRLRKGREKKRKETGRCGGRPKYGETPEEKEVLKTIAYSRRLQRGHTKRRSFQKIADELNARNIPTRNGGRWCASTVWQIYTRR